MKHIAAFLLATFVAISSFAQTQSWRSIGVGNVGPLYVRNVDKVDTKGEFTADFRIDYLVKVKTATGEIVERSFMKVRMNCFSRESRILGDAHASNGSLLPKYTNFWVKSGDKNPAATSAGTIVLNQVCPEKNYT